MHAAMGIAGRKNKPLQLTVEQRRFELHGATYTWIFFSMNSYDSIT